MKKRTTSAAGRRRTAYVDSRPVGISVIIPVYNARPHLSDCLKSLTGQTFGPFEVILIDDGSSDGSTRICRGYARRRSNFQFIRQVNAGAGPARNRGLEQAQGKYIAFIDADDLVDPDYLSALWEKAERHRADLVGCKYGIEFTETGVRQGMFDEDKKLWASFGPHCFSNELTAADREKYIATINYPWNKLYRRTLLTNYRIRFPSTPVHNDIPVHWKSILFARRIVLEDRTLYTHKKLSNEAQLTNIFDRRRMTLFDTLDIVERTIAMDASFAHYLPTFVSFKIDMIFWARTRMKREFLPEFDQRVIESLSDIHWRDLVAYYRSRNPPWRRWREIEHYVNRYWFRRGRENLAQLFRVRMSGLSRMLRRLRG